MLSREGLVATDLITAFLGRRVQPLQHRPHRICDMSGLFNPCRLSTKELTSAQIARRVNNITTANGLVLRQGALQPGVSRASGKFLGRSFLSFSFPLV